MSTLSPIMDADVHHHHVHVPGGADACMFCDPSMGFRATSEDALAFRDHLAANENCQREYQMWKTTIQDEWLGD